MRTHEEIVGVRRVAADSKELHEIVKLAMDITAYLWNANVSTKSHASQYECSRACTYRNRGGDSDNIALFNQELACFVAEFSYLGLGDWTACSQLRDGPLRQVSHMQADKE